MRYFLPFVIGLMLCACNQNEKSTERHPTTNIVQDSLTTELKQIQAKGVINGFGVAIVNQDKVLYKNGFGLADASNNRAYSAQTVQNIASISKTLIGIALMKAQELGLLSIDDPVAKYLDFAVVNPNFPDQHITIKHLATHTSSITDGDIYGEKSYILKAPIDTTAAENMEIPKEFNPPTDMTSMQALLSSLLDKKGQWYTDSIYLPAPPGQTYEYTNIGATLAAYIIEAASGEAYSAFTKKHILEPLGMHSSGWSFDAIDFSQHTKLYATPEKPFPFYSLITYPDGGLITSVDDLSRYLMELIRAYAGEGTLLTKASYEAIFTPYLSAENFEERDPDDPYNDEFNSGLFMGFSAKGYIGHTGGDPGVSSFMYFNTKNKIGRILMINTDLINDQGVQEFFSIWNKLEAYQLRLN